MFFMRIWRACRSVLSEWVSGKDNTKSIQHLTSHYKFCVINLEQYARICGFESDLDLAAVL